MAKFDWDENKRQRNISKHGLDFKDAHKAFADDYAFFTTDPRYEQDERWLLIGKLDEELVVVIAYKELQNDESEEETYRIISMRKAERHEVARYTDEKLSRLPANDDPMTRLLEQLEKERILKEHMGEIKEESRQRRQQQN